MSETYEGLNEAVNKANDDSGDGGIFGIPLLYIILLCLIIGFIAMYIIKKKQDDDIEEQLEVKEEVEKEDKIPITSSSESSESSEDLEV